MSANRHQNSSGNEDQTYINHLKSEGKLISAQPLDKEGVIISGTKSSFKAEPIIDGREMQVGYYHILAKDIDEAIKIAKQNPEFEFSTTAKIEVRPIKMKEAATGFVYPKLV